MYPEKGHLQCGAMIKVPAVYY